MSDSHLAHSIVNKFEGKLYHKLFAETQAVNSSGRKGEKLEKGEKYNQKFHPPTQKYDK
jgi:hypothetical protein